VDEVEVAGCAPPVDDVWGPAEEIACAAALPVVIGRFVFVVVPPDAGAELVWVSMGVGSGEGITGAMGALWFVWVGLHSFLTRSQAYPSGHWQIIEPTDLSSVPFASVQAVFELFGV
jgi:hypothetical protein